jgi:hypothetical protein
LVISFFFLIASSSNFSKKLYRRRPNLEAILCFEAPHLKTLNGLKTGPSQCTDDRFLFNPKKGSWILNYKNFLPPWKILVNLLSDSGQQIAMEQNPQVFIKWKNLCLQFFEIEKPLILVFWNFSELKKLQDWVFPKTLIWSSSFYKITSKNYKNCKFYRRLFDWVLDFLVTSITWFSL